MLPMPVLNRLRLGRAVAARVRATLPHHHAWVRVQPLLKAEGARWDEPASEERRAISLDGTDPIRGFEIRRVEVDAGVMEDIWEVGKVVPSIDQRIEVATEAELADALSRWLGDPAALRIPSLVGYV